MSASWKRSTSRALLFASSYYLVKSPAATVAAGSDSIDIAATFVYYPTPESAPEQVDIIHIYGLDIQVGTEWQEVNKYQLAERNDYEGYTGPAEVFRERDTNILDIRPALDADYSLRLWYLPPGTDFAELSTFDGAGGLSSSTATFDGISGWEDWLIYDAGIRCATRDAGVADNLPDLRSELARHEKHILSSSRKRVRVTALRRLDTRGRRYALSRRNRWGFSP